MSDFTSVYLRGFQAGMAKRAAAEISSPEGYMGMAHQKFMPQYQRRVGLDPSEEALIAKGEKRIIPKIFKSDADSPTVDMASPKWSAGFSGAAGAAIGGIGGAAIGGLADDENGAAVGAGLGAVTGGLITALMGYHGRKAENATLTEALRRLPPGATRRDMKADPVYQAEQDRKAQLEAARMTGRG